MSAHSQPSDRNAAYTGLILGAVVLGAMVYGIVMLTNSHFEGKEGAKTESGAAK
jgi:hypothetical protein